MRLLFVCGLGSRYSYLAASQLPRLEEAAGRRFDWQPVNSIALIRAAHEGRSPFDAEVLRGPYAPAYRAQDVARWAAYLGIPYHEPRLGDLAPDDMATACWRFEDPDQRRAMATAVLDAVFAEGRTMSRVLLRQLAAAIGDGANEQEEGAARARHQQALGQALGLGAFGVPTLVIGDELFWGADRLPLVERCLLGQGSAERD